LKASISVNGDIAEKMKRIMKNISSFLFVSLIPFVVVAVAQVQEPLERQQARVEKNAAERVLEKEVNSSLTVKRLDERLSKAATPEAFSQAISEIVQANDRSLVPYLKARLILNNEGWVYIEVALVRLGEREYFDKTVAELKSKDIMIPYYAVWKLSLLKTKDAYRLLYELLDDETPRVEKQSIDFHVQTLSALVKERLASMADNPPKGIDVYETKAWKAWFARNKHLIE
jgi:hypothetical protein